MSTNVSLTNAGTSLNFDGQALQNQQEAEIEREEQLQQNELRQLLSKEFDELDDDILSMGSSEEDSANNSQLSVHQDSFSAGRPAEGPPSDANISSGAGVIGRAAPSATSTAIHAPQPAAGLHQREVPQPVGQQPAKVEEETSGLPLKRADPSAWVGPGGWRAGPEGVQPAGVVPLPSPPSYPASLPSPAVPSTRSWSNHDSTLQSSSPYSVAPSSVPPAYTSTHPLSAAEQWGIHGNHYPHPDSQPSWSKLQPHPYPSYPYPSTTADSFTSQQGDGQGQSTPFAYGNHHHFHFHGEGGSSLDAASDPDAGGMFAAGGTQRSWEKVGAGLGVGAAQFPSDSTNNNNNASGLNNGGDSGRVVFTGLLQDWNTQQGGLLSAAPQGEFRDYDSAAYLSSVPNPHCVHLPASVGNDVTHSGDVGNIGVEGQQGQVTDMHPPSPPFATTAGKGGDDFDHYTVQYRKPVSSSRPPAGSELKVRFITQEGDSEDTAQLRQLQLLYESRGRQLEDLKEELNSVTQDSAKERRRLKHLLSVATGEKEGLETSLQQCQQLLQETREDQTESGTQLHSTQAQVQALLANKEELAKKLECAETTIENLSHQVAGLQGTDSLTQARRQHETVVSTMQQRFDTQLLHLKQQLDSANDDITAKADEVNRLQTQVRQQTKLAEDAQISRGETINQLTRSLEESQHRCQALLSASSSEESAKLRAQLQQSLMSKKMSDDMCTSLQAEVQELKEQLTMLESAASLGAISTPLSGAFTDDSISDLGIRKTLDFSTPETPGRSDNGVTTSDDLISKLRKELERCVHSNRSKRSQLAEVLQQSKVRQTELEQLQQEVAESRQTVQDQRAKLNAYQERLGGSLQPSAVESRLNRDLENMRVERQALLQDMEEYKARLNEVGANEERLTEMNRDLKRQIGAMVTQHDKDKQEVIERCRQASDEAHQVAMEKLEHAVRSEMFADKQEIVLKYEEELTATKEKLREAEEELDKVKDMYVQTSRDLTRQEQALQDKGQELQDAIASERTKWEREQKVTMETQCQQHLAEERTKWDAALGEELERALQDRLETERKAWEAESSARGQKDWQETLESEREKWQAEKDAIVEKVLQDRLQSERERWASEQQRDLDRDLRQSLQKERAGWESERESEWKKRLEKEKKTWEMEKEGDWAERLQRERVSWQVGANREALDQSDAAVEHARRRWQQEAGEQLQQVKGELEQCRQQHKAQLVAMETRWSQELTEKEAELERRLQRDLETEIASKLAEQKAELLGQAERSLQLGLSGEKKQHSEELAKAVARERDKAVAEARQQMEQEKQAAVEAARGIWQAQQTQHSQHATQGVAKWKEELLQAQTELSRQQEAWHSERSKLAAEKDEERRQAVAGVRLECQADLERVMEESKATLDSTLQRHRQSVEELESRYKDELASLRAVEQELRQAAPSPTKDTKNSSGKDGAGDFSREVSRLRKEIEKRDRLLQQADSHMAREVQRLRDSLTQQYSRQREHDTQRLQAQHSQERAELERKLELLSASFSSDPQEKSAEEAAGRDSEDLAAELCQAEAELAAVRREVESTRRRAEQLEGQRKEAADRLQLERDTLAGQVKERQRELQVEMGAREQLEKQVTGLKQQVERGKARLTQLEAALKAVNRQHLEDVQRLEESLRATHNQELADLSAQLAQAQKQHAAELAELDSEHKAEQRALVEELDRRHQAETHSMMEEVRRQTRRALANTPTQTDKDDNLYNLKDQYLSLMHKMKAEVMDHINKSNERAALMMKTEIRMERQRTIEHLRHRCKSRLPQILSPYAGRYPEKGVWSQLEQALDLLFDTVASSSGSTSTSAVVTPRSSEEEEGDNAAHTHNSSQEEGGNMLRGVVSRLAPPPPSSFPATTPLGSSSEHFASLPSALLSRVHFESDSSFQDPPSAVFYSLQPDDTASVTTTNSSEDNDSEPELKALAAPSKRVAFSHSDKQIGKAVGSGPSRQRRCTPPKKVKSGLSVFAGQGGEGASRSFLLSPKLHREDRGEEEEEGEGERGGGRERESSEVWKEAGGGAQDWAAAVGNSSSLWRAFEDLRSLELLEEQPGGDPDPRRRLQFTSLSLLDGSMDSSASSSASQQQRRGHNHQPARGSALTRSEDLSGRSLLRQARAESSSASHRHPRRRLSPQPIPSRDVESHCDEPRPDRQVRVISRFLPQNGSKEEKKDVDDGSDVNNLRPQRHSTSRSVRHFSSPEKPLSGLSKSTRHLTASRDKASSNQSSSQSKAQSAKRTPQRPTGSQDGLGGHQTFSPSGGQGGGRAGDTLSYQESSDPGAALQPSSKALLNPRDFVVQSAANKKKKDKASRGDNCRAVAGDTLDSMLARLGVGGAASGGEGGAGHTSILHHRSRSAPGHKMEAEWELREADGAGYDPDLPEQHRSSSTLPGTHSNPHQHNSYKSHRTRSAENVTAAISQPHHHQPQQHEDHHQHRKAGSAPSRSVVAPQASSKSPSLRGHSSKEQRQQQQQQHRPEKRRGAGDRVEEDTAVRRSLEDLRQALRAHHAISTPLSHAGRAKSRSEQALNVLGEAVEEGGGVGVGGYKYMPLKHFLPPPSPSTSLVSTYSVSEGDLSHLPQHLAWEKQHF